MSRVEDMSSKIERLMTRKRHRPDGEGFFTIKEGLDAGIYSHRFLQKDQDGTFYYGLIRSDDVGFGGWCADTPVLLVDRLVYGHHQVQALPEIENSWPSPDPGMPFVVLGCLGIASGVAIWCEAAWCFGCGRGGSGVCGRVS